MADRSSQGGTTQTRVTDSLPAMAARRYSGVGGIPKEIRLIITAMIILIILPTMPPSRPMAPASDKNRMRISRT